MAPTKKPTEKRETKAVKKPLKKVEPKIASGMTTDVLDVHGKVTGSVKLPKESFDKPYNKQLIAQAVRVYLANQREGGAATKTRGLVEGSTRKIYKQKGTGRARHGGIRAPIFVGGGIVFGPQPRDFRLGISKSMKRAALLVALSFGRRNGVMKVVEGYEALPLKTKPFAQSFKDLGILGSVLFVTGEKTASVYRAIRNIDRVFVCPMKDLTAYHVITKKTIIFTKDALDAFIGKIS